MHSSKPVQLVVLVAVVVELVNLFELVSSHVDESRPRQSWNSKSVARPVSFVA